MCLTLAKYLMDRKYERLLTIYRKKGILQRKAITFWIFNRMETYTGGWWLKFYIYSLKIIGKVVENYNGEEDDDEWQKRYTQELIIF